MQNFIVKLFVSTTLLWAVPAVSQTSTGSAQTVSSASYSASVGLAPGSIATTLGSNLAITTASAPPNQTLPTTLGGTTVAIVDSKGGEQLCPLFFVSPNQVNHLIPEGVALGNATIRVTSGDRTITTIANVQINVASLGLFSANASGNGPAAAYAQRFRANGIVVTTPLAVYDASLNRFVSQPIDLGVPGDQTFITLFGTGLHSLPATSFQAMLNGSRPFPVTYIGAQGQFLGLDQVNIGPILASDATGAFESGFGDITLSLLSSSGSGLAQSNEISFRIIHPDFIPLAQLLSSDTGIRGQTIQQFTIWGDYLASATGVSISPAEGLTLSNLNVTDTKITFDLKIDEGATLGDRQLRVTTPYGTSTPALKFSILDPASLSPFLTNLTVNSNIISFNFASPGVQLLTGSLLNSSVSEINYVGNTSKTCQSSYQSSTLIRPGQTSGQVQYTFSPALANNFFSRHYANLSLSVTDFMGRKSNTVSVRVDDPVFGCSQLPTI